MKGGQPNTPQSEPDPANLDEAELVSNQQAIPLRWFCGERKLPLVWGSPLYNVFSKDVPGQDGKK